MKTPFAKILSAFGYELRKVPARPYDVATAGGEFDYARYRQIQTQGNKQKIEHVFVLEDNIAFLADYIKRDIENVEFGICHGTRRGKEQEWFRKYLGCDVIGTEISDTAAQFPHTIQWDFHETKPEWINAVDFIYSNSFDHSYDPEKCLNAWMTCVKPGGVCILEHTSAHEVATELDPFGALLPDLPYLILRWGQGRFCVTEILTAPSKSVDVTHCSFLVVRHVQRTAS